MSEQEFDDLQNLCSREGAGRLEKIALTPACSIGDGESAKEVESRTSKTD